VTTNSLVDMYQNGKLTADHLMVQCLHMIDPANPELVLSTLPHEILMRMIEFARQYRPNGMVTNYGILPATDQVDAAKKWLGDNCTVNTDTRDSNGTDWDKYQMKTRVLEILATASTDPNHEIGRFFMTPYQIAIEFARRFQDDFKRMGRPIGGAGAGNKALTKYIANQLSRRIKAEDITDIEMLMATGDAGYPNSLNVGRSCKSKISYTLFRLR